MNIIKIIFIKWYLWLLSVFLVLLVEREKFYWRQRTQSDHLTWSHPTLLPLRPIVDNKKTKKKRLKCDLREVQTRWQLNKLQSWTKVLGHLHFWAFSNSHRPNPSPHPINNVARVYPEFCLCIGWGNGKLQEHFEKDALFHEGPRMTEKYEYRTTVPRTFVHDCRFILFLSRLVLFSPRTNHLWKDTEANAWSATNRTMNKRHLQFILHNCRL